MDPLPVVQNLLGKHHLLFCSFVAYLPSEDVLRTFPYYQELDFIWKGIPSFDSKLVSAKPKTNHAISLLNIVAPKASSVNPTPEEENVDVQDRDAHFVEDEADKEEVEEVATAQTIDEEDVSMNDDTLFNNDDHVMDDEPSYEEPEPVRKVCICLCHWSFLRPTDAPSENGCPAPDISPFK